MAYVTREEFSSILLTLYKELHERTKTQRYSADRKEATEQPTKPIATITKLDPVSTIETRKPETEKQSDSDYHFWNLVVAWATFVVVVAYATVAALQWCAMQRQLEMTDRPWIKDNVISAVDFGWQNGHYLGWAVNVRAENVGHSVATGLFPKTKLISVYGENPIDYPRREAKKMCDDADAQFEKMKNDPTAWGTSVFPEESRLFAGQNVYLMPAEVEAKSFDGGTELGKSIDPMLIGCIAYHYSSSDKPHHTWFVYILTHSDDETLQEPTRVFFGIGKNVPTDKVVLTKVGQFAD
jgi:hypothetical protein